MSMSEVLRFLDAGSSMLYTIRSIETAQVIGSEEPVDRDEKCFERLLGIVHKALALLKYRTPRPEEEFTFSLFVNEPPPIWTFSKHILTMPFGVIVRTTQI